MKKYRLIGEKLGHSLSPQLHKEIFNSENIDGEYKLLEIPKIYQDNLIERIKKENIDGFNITIPYKEKIMNSLDKISDEAKKIGAVNVVKIENGSFLGYNTDYYGVIKTFEILGITPKNKKCVILGSGGASKSVIIALEDLGAKKIIVVTRDISKRESILNQFTNIEVVNYNDNLEGDILINTTPIGMYPNIENSPVNEDVVKRFLAVVDIIYNPRDTKLLQMAKNNNIPAIDGLYMLIEQGIKAQEIWQNREFKNIDYTEIEKNLEDELRKRRS